MDSTIRRVAITGIGAVSPMGLGTKALWDGIVECRSTAGPITMFDTSNHKVKFGCTIPNFTDHPDLDPRETRRMDPFVRYGVTAAIEAVKDSGIEGNIDLDRVGVIIASGIGGIHELEKQLFRMFERGPSRVSPLLIPKMILDMASGMVAMRYGFTNVNFGLASACASATHGIGESFRYIKHGYADAIVAGGAEAGISPLSLAGFGNMGALSSKNDNPTTASRPFDKNRDGFVMGEGAGVLVLEEMEHAKRRGARIYGEVTGYGHTCDAHHITEPAPGGLGAQKAMRMACSESHFELDDVDYINAHGTSTPANDPVESAAINSLFQRKIPLSSTKSMIGHLLGASGALELITVLFMMKHGVAHPTINFEEADPRCDVDCIPNVPREMKIRKAISNSFGFGGHNACIAVKAFEE